MCTADVAAMVASLPGVNVVQTMPQTGSRANSQNSEVHRQANSDTTSAAQAQQSPFAVSRNGGRMEGTNEQNISSESSSSATPIAKDQRVRYLYVYLV